MTIESNIIIITWYIERSNFKTESGSPLTTAMVYSWGTFHAVIFSAREERGIYVAFKCNKLEDRPIVVAFRNISVSSYQKSSNYSLDTQVKVRTIPMHRLLQWLIMTVNHRGHTGYNFLYRIFFEPVPSVRSLVCTLIIYSRDSLPCMMQWIVPWVEENRSFVSNVVSLFFVDLISISQFLGCTNFKGYAFLYGCQLITNQFP